MHGPYAEDRPDLARLLLRQRVTFTIGLMAVEFRLAVNALGLGRMKVGDLLLVLDTLEGELHKSFQTLQSPAAALEKPQVFTS